MSDLSGPSRTGYGLAASPRFLGAEPAKKDFGSYFGNELGHALGDIGVAAFHKPKQDISALKTKEEIERDRRKDTARGDIADLVSQIEPGGGNLHTIYLQALQKGYRGGLTPTEIDEVLQGGGAASGADENTMARTGHRAGTGADTFYTPEGAAARRAEVRGNTLADQAAAIAEQRRKEGVTAGAATLANTRASAEHQREEGVRLTNDKSLKDYEAGLKPNKQLPVGAVDDLNKEIGKQFHDRLGIPQFGEDNLETPIPSDPGIQTQIKARAAELVGQGKNPVEAVTMATDELATLDPNAELGGETFGGYLGKNRGPKVTLKGGASAGTRATGTQADPLGIR